MSGEILCYLQACVKSQEILRTPGNRITLIAVINLYLVIQRNNQSCPYKSHAVNCLITCVVFPVTCLSIYHQPSFFWPRLKTPDQIGFHTVLRCNRHHKIKSESFQLLQSNLLILIVTLNYYVDFWSVSERYWCCSWLVSCQQTRLYSLDSEKCTITRETNPLHSSITMM